jgi:hypothetical protein
MRTNKLLLSALLALGAWVAAPASADASPKKAAGYYTAPHQPQYRPANRTKSNNNVPELSVGAAAGALSLLGGGIMVLTGRRRRQKSG